MLSVSTGRRIVKEERLIDRKDRRNLSYDTRSLRDLGLLGHVRSSSLAQPKPETAPHPDATGDKAEKAISTDELLEATPLCLFDVPELPTSAGDKWVCPYDECHSEYQTTTAAGTATTSVYPGTPKYDRETIKFRQTISRHLLEHLSRDPVVANLIISLTHQEG